MAIKMLDTRFTHTTQYGEEQPYIKSGETRFSMDKEVEPLVPVSNDYLYYVYGERVGEMDENAKIQDGGDKMQLISLLKLIKLNVLL